MHFPLEAKLGLRVTAVPPEEEIDNPSGFMKLKEERKKEKERAHSEYALCKSLWTGL